MPLIKIRFKMLSLCTTSPTAQKEFETEVANHLNTGWTLHGAPFVFDGCIYQALKGSGG